MSYPKLTALVIEDEERARNSLIEGLNDLIDFKVIGWADSVQTAFELLESTPADVVFLDIRIIEGTAFDLLQMLKKASVPIPPIVVTTAFRDYDYAKEFHNKYNDLIVHILNKPFWDEWNMKHEAIISELQRRRRLSLSLHRMEKRNDLVQIPGVGQKNYFVNPSGIIYISTGEKGSGRTKVVCDKLDFDCRLSLADLLPQLPYEFLQISRFTVVNTERVALVDQMESKLTTSDGIRHTIGLVYFQVLCERLGLRP